MKIYSHTTCTFLELLAYIGRWRDVKCLEGESPSIQKANNWVRSLFCLSLSTAFFLRLDWFYDTYFCLWSEMFLKWGIALSLSWLITLFTTALSGWYFSSNLALPQCAHVSFINELGTSSLPSSLKTVPQLLSVAAPSEGHHWPPSPWTCPEKQSAP